jgi:hypothetical protein
MSRLPRPRKRRALALDEWNLNNSHTGRYDFFLIYPFECLKVGRQCPNLQACGLLAPLSSNRMGASPFGGVSSLNLGHPMLAWGGFLLGGKSPDCVTQQFTNGAELKCLTIYAHN